MLSSSWDYRSCASPPKNCDHGQRSSPDASENGCDHKQRHGEPEQADQDMFERKDLHPPALVAHVDPRQAAPKNLCHEQVDEMAAPLRSRSCSGGWSRSLRGGLCSFTETQNARSRASARLAVARRKLGTSSRGNSKGLTSIVEGPLRDPHPTGPLTERPFSGRFFSRGTKECSFLAGLRSGSISPN